ncbi:MAG: FtsX-like permease family protein [Eubacteriales bacterium]|nr:FtsX-like permease family protein [Eubacteriales bacterium]
MRKVKNNQVMKRLSDKSFQASRTRNIIAAIAIAMTAILFTAVFTIGLGMVETSQRSIMRQVGTDMHGVIKDLTREQYEQFRRHPSVKEEGFDVLLCEEVENPEFLKRHLEVHCRSVNLYKHDFIDIIDGRAPEQADEILMDETSMGLLGMEPKAGQQVTLQMKIHQSDAAAKERTFTVVGVIKAAEGMNVGFVYAAESYLDVYSEELFPSDGQVGSIDMSVSFSSDMNIQENLNKIIVDNGYSTDVDSPDYIDSNTNWAYISESAGGSLQNMIAIGAALLLIAVTGYLIIYNTFQISVIRDIRYYGLLKTIGTTGRQIKRLLRRQALRLCIMGIPAGLVLGYLAGRIVLPVMLTTGGSTVSMDDVSASPRPWIFAGAVIFTVITVLISEWKPGQIAAKVSPVEALHYSEHEKRKKKLKKSTDGGKLVRMAFSNLGRNKGRTAVVICSLSLTVILLNSVYTISHSLDRKGFLSKMILSEAVIGNVCLWNYDYRPYDEKTAEEESLTESFISACEQQESFLEGGRIYGDTVCTTMKLENWDMPDYIEVDENGIPGYWMNGIWISYAARQEDGIYAPVLGTAYFGIEPFVLSKMTVIEGETDTETIWEKLQTGNYLIYAADVDDDNQVIQNKVKHHAGDKVTLDFSENDSKEYEIISVIKRHQYSLSNYMQNDFEYYTSADEFLKHRPKSYLMRYLMDTKEGGEDAMEEFLKDYTENTEPNMNYESRKTFEGMMKEMLGTVTLVGTALAAMIGIIGVLNFINTMLTGIVVRKREFAMMQAIGMTKRQLVGMLMLEGLFYAGLTVIFSLVFGSLFSFGVIRMIGEGMWFLKYRFTILPLAVACPVLLILGACVPKIVYALQKKESVVERLRE